MAAIAKKRYSDRIIIIEEFMNIIELTLADESGTKVSINKNNICYIADTGHYVKIQFIGNDQNYIEVKEKYDDIILMV